MESDCRNSNATASPTIESRFTIFLENNDSLPPSVIREIKGLLSEPTKELKRKDAEIEVLGHALKTLETECEALQNSTSEYELIRAPIRRLPPDILLEIFYHCLPTHRNPVMSYTEAPLLLTCICQSWRSAALSSPRLWARLRIPLYRPIIYSNDYNNGNIWRSPDTLSSEVEEKLREDADKVMHSRQKVVKAWLSHSGSCPLSISLSYQGTDTLIYPGEIPNHNPIDQIVDTILFFSSTIEDLELLMPFKVYQTFLSDISPDRFPILRRLKVCFTGAGVSNIASGGTQIALVRTPNLRSLSNAPPILIFDPLGDALSTENLSCLSLYISISSMAAVKLLQRCRRLKHCKLMISNDPLVEAHPDEDTIFLPDLLNLTLSVDVTTDRLISAVYKSVYAPQLTRFEYRQYVEHVHQTIDPAGPGPSTGVHYLLEKSSLLTKLSIDAGFLSTEDIRLCLRSSSQVTHFQVGTSSKTSRQNEYGHWDHDQQKFDLDTLILPLEPSSANSVGPSYSSAREEVTMVQSEVLLPKLEVFEGHAMPDRTTDTELREFILGRLGTAAERNGVSSLKKVKMVFGRSSQLDVETDVQRVIKKTGMEDIELALVYFGSDSRPMTGILVQSPWVGLTEHISLWGP